MPFASYSPSLHVYGYEIDQPAAIRYLIAKHPEWERRYTYFGCHYKALDAVSKDLSQSCELTLHSNPIWIGGGYISFAMVFYGEDIEEANRDPQKLEKLEKLLASTGISYKPTPQLERLCSAAYRKFPVEPLEMSRRPPPPDWSRRSGLGLIDICDELNLLRRRAQSEQKPLEQKGAGRERPQDGKQPPKKKRRTRSGEEPGRQADDHGASTKPRKVRNVSKSSNKGASLEQRDGAEAVSEPVIQELEIKDPESQKVVSI